MKWQCILLLIIFGCTGSLSDEQRQKVKEDMANHEIRKVSEAEIMDASYAKGRQLISQLDAFKSDSSKIDSVVIANGGKIKFIVPGQKNGLAVEQALIDAYIASGGSDLRDNVQKIRRADGTASDSILYSKPVVVKSQDGVDVLTGVWNIWLSQKELIMAMKK